MLRTPPPSRLSSLKGFRCVVKEWVEVDIAKKFWPSGVLGQVGDLSRGTLYKKCVPLQKDVHVYDAFSSEACSVSWQGQKQLPHVQPSTPAACQGTYDGIIVSSHDCIIV